MLFPKLLVYFLRILLVLICLTVPHDIYTWDLAVANDEALDLLTIDGHVELSTSNTQTLSDLSALTYDPIQQRFFVSVTGKDRNSSVYIFYIQQNTVVPLIPRGENNVYGLAFDVANEVLYWTDGNGHGIWWRNMKDPSAQNEKLLDMKTQVTMGIAVSNCHRVIVWANSNTNASINRAELDGTNSFEIVTDTHQPTGVAIDEPYGKVYWSDDRWGIYYRIERCNLDGTNRELLLHRTHQDPIGLAIFGSNIIWSDVMSKRIYSLSTDMTFPNHTKARLEPDLVYQYKNTQTPSGIVAFRNRTVTCEPIKILRSVEELGEKITDKTDTNNGSGAEIKFCFNSGDLNGNSCRCKRGFSGLYCEVSTCYNHCLHGGSCYLDKLGYPECRCLLGYEGRRCEKDVCDDYCLSGGRCYIESGNPVCRCPEHVNGQRCEVTVVPHQEPQLQGLPNDVAVIAGLSFLGAVLLIAVIILTWRVLILRQRPRIKKRYIVNKPVNGGRQQNQQLRTPTPLTHTGVGMGVAPPIEQCEITIENCCNMNICETPCFEPNLRTSRSSSYKKTDDRKTLLNNMEGEPSISD